MSRLKWGRLTPSDQAELWQLWSTGKSVSDIGRALGRVTGTVRAVVERHGGYVPAERTRANDRLTLEHREEISRGISSGCSYRQIGEAIGKSPSTVSREVNRNGGAHRYRAAQADAQAWERARRPKACLLQQRPQVCQYVAEGLSKRWSPQQIAKRIEQAYPHDQSMRVSHETIYRSLFVQSRGVLKKELSAHLRSSRKFRHAQKASSKGQKRGQIPDAISIRDRPAEVEDRAVPGHWEGDLISGKGNTHIATLVERHSRYVMLVKVPGKDTEGVVKSIARKVKQLPAALRRSLTWDNGKEMTDHKDFTVATDVKVYFCDPSSPWQRGSNENTNGLLRQYFPKGTDLSVHSQTHLDWVANEMNQRPRQTLQFRTPAEKLAEVLR